MKINLGEEAIYQDAKLTLGENKIEFINTTASKLDSSNGAYLPHGDNKNIFVIIVVTIILTILLTVCIMILINKRKKVFLLLRKNVYGIEYKKKSDNIKIVSSKMIINENVYVKTSEISKSQSLSLLDKKIDKLHQQQSGGGDDKNIIKNDDKINITENLVNNDTLKSKKKLMNALYYNS